MAKSSLSVTPVQIFTVEVSKVSSRTLALTVEVHLKHSQDSRKKIWKLPKTPSLSKSCKMVSDNFKLKILEEPRALQCA